MKALVLLISVFSLSTAKQISDVNSLLLENLKFNLDRNVVEDFLQKYEKGDTSEIISVVNDYADRLFKNIEELAIRDHLDPFNLTDVKDNFLTASITLKNGHMDGISTISRARDVTVSYSSQTKILEAYFPIVFSNLKFTYDYHVVLLLIGPKGSIIGKVANYEMDVKLQFDFNTYQATVQKLQTTNKGHVSLTFHGNAITDIVVNILSEFVTTVLQPLLALVIEGIVADAANLVVDVVNRVIDIIFNLGHASVPTLI